MISRCKYFSFYNSVTFESPALWVPEFQMDICYVTSHGLKNGLFCPESKQWLKHWTTSIEPWGFGTWEREKMGVVLMYISDKVRKTMVTPLGLEVQ